MAEDDDLLGGDVHEDDEEYLYNDWGVDYVDLDFKTGKSNNAKSINSLLLTKSSTSVRPEDLAVWQAVKAVIQSVQSVWQGWC